MRRGAAAGRLSVLLYSILIGPRCFCFLDIFGFIRALYSLDFCVVSGNDLNDEDTDMIPFTYEYEGIQIVFCCKPCLPKFKKDPAKYMAIIKEEMEDMAKEPSS